MSQWSDTKVSLNYMFHVLYPNIRQVDDVVKTIYNNCIPSAINNIFSHMYGINYEGATDIEKNHISTLRRSWKDINERGWLNS